MIEKQKLKTAKKTSTILETILNIAYRKFFAIMLFAKIAVIVAGNIVVNLK